MNEVDAISGFDKNSAALQILGGIGDLKSSVSGVSATLQAQGADLTYLRQRVDALWNKVDEIERSKATREDLQSLEVRVGQTLLQVRAQTTVDLDRLEKSKIGHDQFSVDAFDNVALRLEQIESKLEVVVRIEGTIAQMQTDGSIVGKKVETLDGLRAKIVPWAVVLSGISAFLGWLIPHIASAVISYVKK